VSDRVAFGRRPAKNEKWGRDLSRLEFAAILVESNVIVLRLTVLSRGSRLLTEHQIARSWRKLFTGGQVVDDTFEKAEALLTELRPESPLRHRLAAELREIRKRGLQKQKATG
jgi:hypothetical protein